MLDALRPLPTLPLELVVHIFTLALPSCDLAWTAFSERARWLLAVSTLNRTWREWAQRQLVEHVVLRDIDAARAFVRETGPVIRRTGCKVKTLRCGGTNAGRPMYAAKLDEILEVTNADADLEELWLVSASGVDLQQLRGLANLHTLVCVDAQLAVPPSTPQTPVPPVPPCLQSLRTLVLKHVEVTPSLRTILFEDHQFPALETLYFDNHEVLTQVFDGNPDAMPRLRALSPAADIQPAYLEALHGVDDAGSTDPGSGNASRRSSLGSVRRGSFSRRQSTSSVAPGSSSDDYEQWPNGPLRLLSITAPFLRHLAHFAPFLPLGITHLRLDFGPSDDIAPQELRLLLDNADFIELFDPPEQHGSGRRTGVQVVSSACRGETGGIAEMFEAIGVGVERLMLDRGAEWVEDPSESGRGEAGRRRGEQGGPVEAWVAPQDRVVPWGFLRVARQAIDLDYAERRRRRGRDTL